MSEEPTRPANAAVLLDITDRIATITLNQPDRRNPMSPELIADLPGVLAAIRDDPDVRCVIITGAGRSFSAGADFRTLGGLVSESGVDGIAGVQAGIEKISQALERLKSSISALEDALKGLEGLTGGH